MASIFKRGRKYWIRYSYRGREFRESAGSDRRLASRALAKRLVEIETGKFYDPRKRCDLTLTEFAERRFLPWSRQVKRSWVRDEQLARNVCALLGDVNLSKLTVGDVEKFKTLRAKGASPFARTVSNATINRELAALRKMLNLAAEDGVVETNPLAGKIKMLREADPRVKYLEPGQAGRLLAECSGRIRPAVHLLLLTGCRLQEVIGLRWSEIDLAAGAIRLPGERTKNKEPRTVPLSTDARRLLLHVSREDGCPWVFHEGGEPMQSIRNGFEGACRRAGLADFRLHDLRHAFGSALAMRGESLQVIAELLGHKTMAVAKRYAHLAPGVLHRATEQAAAYMRGAEGKQGEEVADAGSSGVVSFHNRG